MTNVMLTSAEYMYTHGFVHFYIMSRTCHVHVMYMSCTCMYAVSFLTLCWTPHIRTARIGSLLRRTLFFCCLALKCLLGLNPAPLLPPLPGMVIFLTDNCSQKSQSKVSTPQRVLAMCFLLITSHTHTIMVSQYDTTPLCCIALRRVGEW